MSNDLLISDLIVTKVLTVVLPTDFFDGVYWVFNPWENTLSSDNIYLLLMSSNFTSAVVRYLWIYIWVPPPILEKIDQTWAKLRTIFKQHKCVNVFQKSFSLSMQFSKSVLMMENGTIKIKDCLKICKNVFPISTEPIVWKDTHKTMFLGSAS